MTPSQIKSFIEATFPGLVSERRNSPDGWAFYWGTVQRGANPTRIARVVQRRAGAPVMFKPAVSARLAQDKGLEVPIVGGEKQVRELMEREIELWRRHFEPRATSPRPSESKRVNVPLRPTVPIDSGPTDLVYEELPSTVDPNSSLIYLWQVWTPEGQVAYRYVGKAATGASRPRDHYRRNVRNLLNGKPYRAGKPDEFRAVHRRLAEAMQHGERITLTFLCNVAPGEDINEVERRLQREHGC